MAFVGRLASCFDGQLYMGVHKLSTAGYDVPPTAMPKLMVAQGLVLLEFGF